MFKGNQEVLFLKIAFRFPFMLEAHSSTVSTNAPPQVGSEGSQNCQQIFSSEKTYAKGRLLPRGMWQMAGSLCRAQMAYPGREGSGSWKQSSGNYSWPTSPSHTDNPTPFWAVHLEAGDPRCVVWFLRERAVWCELPRYCFKGGVVTKLQIVRSPVFSP